MWLPPVVITSGAIRQNSGAVDAREAGEGRTEPLAAAGFAPTRRGDEDEDGDGRGHASQQEEEPAPAQHRRGGMGGVRRGEHADAAEGHHPGVQKRNTARRREQRHGLEARHEPAGEAEPDQRAGEHEHAFVRREAEERGPSRRHEQQRRLHPARPVPVEQNAERRLKGGESDEIGRRQEAQTLRREPDVRHQIRRHDRVHRPEQVGEEIAAAERQQHRQGDASESDVMGRQSGGHVPWPFAGAVNPALPGERRQDEVGRRVALRLRLGDDGVRLGVVRAETVPIDAAR